MISAEYTYQFAVNQYREIRNAARRRDRTANEGKVTGAEGALSDIFVTVAPANIRQVAIILHSIGARNPNEINAHTFSIRALCSLLSMGEGDEGKGEAWSSAFSVSATGKSPKIVESLEGEGREGNLFIYTYMRRDCRTQLKHERVCGL